MYFHIKSQKNERDEACLEKWSVLPDEARERVRQEAVRVKTSAQPLPSRAPTADFKKEIPWGTGTVSFPLSIELIKQHTHNVMKFKRRSTLLPAAGLRHLMESSNDMMKDEHKQRAPNCLEHEQQEHFKLNKKMAQSRRQQTK